MLLIGIISGGKTFFLGRGGGGEESRTMARMQNRDE